MRTTHTTRNKAGTDASSRSSSLVKAERAISTLAPLDRSRKVQSRHVGKAIVSTMNRDAITARLESEDDEHVVTPNNTVRSVVTTWTSSSFAMHSRAPKIILRA